MQPARYHPELQYQRITDHRSASVATPCSLLIPPEIADDLERLLAELEWSLGRFLRRLVRKYRGLCLEHGLPQMGGVKRCYQAAGTGPRKVSFRVENEVWVELGLLAAYLGMSRCLLFVWLVRLELTGGGSGFVRVPTNSLEGYDHDYPDRLEFIERLYISQNLYERRLRLRPKHRDWLPMTLRIAYYNDWRSYGLIRRQWEKRRRRA